MADANDAMKKMLDDQEQLSREKVKAGTDVGHNALIEDIRDLLIEAEKGEFHDFINDKYPAPKNALAGRLQAIRENVINGKYDNWSRFVLTSQKEQHEKQLQAVREELEEKYYQPAETISLSKYERAKQEADRKDTDIGVIVHNLIMGEIPHHD